MCILHSFLLKQEPVLPGCFLRARAIGLMPMIDQVKSFSIHGSHVNVLCLNLFEMGYFSMHVELTCSLLPLD